MDSRSNLEALLEGALSSEATETIFLGLIIHGENDVEQRKAKWIESFKSFWSTLTSQQQCDEALTYFINYASKQSTFSKISYLFELLQIIAEKQFIAPRKVCEAVLGSSQLQFSNPTLWQQSFKLVAKLIQQMDYKNMRAVFSVLLYKVKVELPLSVMESQTFLLDDVNKVIQMGLDRNNCFLPSYFVINEISKLNPDSDFHPHWALGEQFGDFVNSFKPLAMMLSISGHFALYPIVGYTGTTTVWNLESSTFKFLMKGPLPYQKPYIEPQKSLLRFVLAHQYSREIVCSMLNLKKQQNQRCEALEELLVDLIIFAMEKTETKSDVDESNQLLWQHLSSQFIFFILFQFTSFPHMVLSLHSRLKERNLQKGRNQLMWVLLQFISGSIQKGPLSTFAPVMKLFELLYPEKEPLPVILPISSDGNCSFAMACIWIHLSKKAKLENTPIQSIPPPQLSKQLEFLQQSIQQKQHDGNGYEITVLCNAYSTTPEPFQSSLQELVSRCYGPMQNSVKLPGGPKGCTATGNPAPLEVSLLDSLTVHSKMSLVQSIVTRIVQVAVATKQQQQQIVLSPGLIETYSRLLVYMEIELLGIKGFLGELLSKILENKAWGVLHALLEMFSYRLHHIQPHYRVNLLTNLHHIANIPIHLTDKTQIHRCLQHTALRLIMGFGNLDIQIQLSMPKCMSDPKQILSKDCQELNLVLIIMIARATHITSGVTLIANWFEGLLKEAMNITPHRWSAFTLSHFPQAMQNFYKENELKDDGGVNSITERVERSYRHIKSLSNDEEIVNYCTDPKQNVPEIFLCILWKILLEKGVVTPVCYQILMKLRTKVILNHLNTFSDFVVNEVIQIINSGTQRSQQVMMHLNDLVWKYHVIPIDRLILSLCLCAHKDKNVQINNFKIIKYLLSQSNELKTRVKKFVAENSPKHWLQINWLESHNAYHDMFPEYHYFEGILETNNLAVQSPDYLPTYFGNVCLRFVPILDILLHRLLELPLQLGTGIIENILNDYGCLFKFHEKPVTYLYNTLHYFNTKLNGNVQLKRKISAAIIFSLKETHHENWVCSQECLEYVMTGKDNWQPSKQYFQNLLDFFVEKLSDKNVHFSSYDWRFNEFPNGSAHRLYVTCVEVMTIPMNNNVVANTLISIICKEDGTIGSLKVRENIMSYINAVALLLVSLPSSYLQVIHQKVVEVIQKRLSNVDISSYHHLPTFFDFYSNHSLNFADYPDYILALFHASCLHSSLGQFMYLSRFLRESLKPLITNEYQLLYVLNLFGPFLQRLYQERTRKRGDFLIEISREFYLIIEQVCRNTSYLVYVDLISDFLYHLKYMYVGDNLRDVIEKTVPHFHLNLQNKLKFMMNPHVPNADEESKVQKQQVEQMQQQTVASINNIEVKNIISIT